jgi:magnesium-transporting ATPase (P-type)
MNKAKLYKIGIKDQCFSTWLFWKWIIYGFAQSALVFYVSFITFNTSPSTETGLYGDLWIEGTFCYGAIVILANMTILYGSFSHTIYSLFFIFTSVGAYFLIIFLFSLIGVSTLDHEFNEIFTYPTYLFNLFLFFFLTFPVDSFLYFLQQNAKDNVELREKR